MSLDPTAPPASGAVDPARSTEPSRSRELSVSVVIPVRDDAEELEKCLALLARQSVRPFEVVVVDNGSTDASAEVARRWGAVVVVEPRPGIPAAAATG